MRILIVDDSKAMRHIVLKAMKSIGYTQDDYEFAEDGEEGLQKAREFQPDLVLSDLHMPKLSGIELAAALKKNAPDIKVGIISIEKDDDTLNEALSAGADFVLHKPFSNEELFNAIDQSKGTAGITHPNHAALSMPTPRALSSILSSLSKNDIDLISLNSRPIDYSSPPFIVVTFSNQKEQMRAFSIFDAMAVNIIAALLNRTPVQEALVQTANNRISDKAMDAFESFVGVTAELIKSDDPKEWFDVYSIHQSENPKNSLNKHLTGDRYDIAAYNIVSEKLTDGQVILCSPREQK